MVFITGYADTDGGVLLTVPAGKSFAGSINLNASVRRSTAGSTLSKPKIVVSGANADPVAGSILAAVGVISEVISVLNLGALPVTSGSTVVTDIRVMAPRDNSVTIVLQTDGASVAVATAFGSFI